MKGVVPTEEESVDIGLGETDNVGSVILKTSEDRVGDTSMTVFSGGTLSDVRDGIIN